MPLRPPRISASIVFAVALASPTLVQAQTEAPPPAGAQPEPPPPPGAAPPPPPPAAAPAPAPAPGSTEPLPGQPPESVDKTIHRHDGFYFRVGLGFGALNMQRSGELSGTGAGTATTEYNNDSTVKGPGGAFELSIGGTVGSGLVICGTLFAQSVRDPKVEPDDDTLPDADLESDLSFGLIGPGLHWYPDPTGGFHFGGTLGLAYAFAKSPENSPFKNIGGVGGGLSLAIGYDFWISDQWSLGAMARLTGATLHGETTESGLTGKEDDKVSAFALMFTALYH